MNLLRRLTQALAAWTWPFQAVRIDPGAERDIAAIQGQLPDGQFRLRPSPVALALTWFPVSVDHIDHGRQLESDYGVSSGYLDVDAAYDEEIAAFTKAIEDTPPTNAGAAAVVTFDTQRRAHAVGNWHRYAIPLRLRGDTVIRIVPPRDLLGSPIVLETPLTHFLAAVSEHTAAEKYQIMQLRAQRSALLWIFAILVGVYFMTH